MLATHRALCAITLLLTACSGAGREGGPMGVGPDPTLPEPRTSLVPTLNIAPATGWPEGTAPTPAEGLTVQAFATGLDHPRWLHVLPNGDVLVAESNKQPAAPSGLRSLVEEQLMAAAGAGSPSADRITLLRDADHDGIAETRTILRDGLTSPFGMALVGDTLYVADTDALLAFPYTEGATRIDAPATQVVALPSGPPNRHWTKGLTAGPDGLLYVSIGSNSDHGEGGMAAEAGRAAIWQVDPAAASARPFATGLRNPVGLGFEPDSGALWVVVNERDELGDDLVPDYLTSVPDGANFGWPWLYYGTRPDPRVDQDAPGRVTSARMPDYALGSHVAPLGLSFAQGARLGPRFAQGAFIGEHGSWNRRPASGYAVVFVPFVDGRPAGHPVDVLTGFRSPQGDARGRPVGVAVAADGALLVADDVGNTIWRVTAAK
ncbi:sorbosone dehydrogenase family protein (plasmid) [Paroceanicella profunda]|uniref:Sorbosone dehydrogenase family protein n=1 Tax=Paroceanicella profunda TaxID=2579971 RepID=A0A5B8G4K7_9RHOB|nr:sorbosone dehydrogenase family protein [Paroceanicella profunda]